MEQLLNILVIAFVGLIGYWWANQGLYSAFMHLMCVLVAGALGFATWEPFSNILLGVPALQPYAWGVGLMLPFAIYLLVFRVAADKLAPENLNFPNWINLTVGGALGACAGVLTVGVALIGAGHTHSSTQLVGSVGAARTTNNSGQPSLDTSALWVPVHSMTAGFYGYMSETALAPTLSAATLQSTHPNLAQEALGLYRDTYNKSGRLARTSAVPGSIRIDKIAMVSKFQLDTGRTTNAYLVDVHFDPGATTEGQGFAISASQLRLVGGTGDSTVVAYPFAWSQPGVAGGRSIFQFDDVSHYITASPGTTSLDATLVFPADPFVGDRVPRFLNAMGLRLPFTQPDKQTTMAGALTMLLGGAGGAVDIPAGTPAINPKDLTLNDTIMPGNSDLNNLGAMTVQDTNYLFEGTGEYEQGGYRGNKDLVVRGIWSPPKTRVVRLNVGRGTGNSLDFWDDRSKLRETTGEEAILALVDELGRFYYPVGYIHAMSGGDRLVVVKLNRDGEYYQLSKFPNLSSSGADSMWAIFTPATGTKIVGVKLGKEWVATANLDIISIK
jgi:hypothetical protein